MVTLRIVFTSLRNAFPKTSLLYIGKIIFDKELYGKNMQRLGVSIS